MSFLPAEPELTPSQKYSHRITTYVMHPAFLLELSHACVYPWKSSHTLFKMIFNNYQKCLFLQFIFLKRFTVLFIIRINSYFFPSSIEVVTAVIPGYFKRHDIAVYKIEFVIFIRQMIEKLAPQQLLAWNERLFFAFEMLFISKLAALEDYSFSFLMHSCHSKKM